MIYFILHFNNKLVYFQLQVSFGDGLLDVRHRGIPNFPFPEFIGKNNGVGAAAFKSRALANGDDFLALLISN